MNKFRWILLLFVHSFVWAQKAQVLDDSDLPIAPLHGEDEKPVRMPPSPSLPTKSLGALPSRASSSDISKVAPSQCRKPKGKFPWNLEKAKLSDLVDQISRLNCTNFIISSGVKPAQEISIISRTPITVDQAWKAFESTLEANGLAMFKTGDYYKIIQRTDSTRQPIKVLDEGDVLPNDESMVTFLYDLKHISKDIAQSLVKGMISRVGDVIVVGESFLVITDGSSNIRRIMNILGKVDVSGAANRIRIVDLLHADAVQIQQKLNDIFAAKNGGGDPGRPRGRFDEFGPATGGSNNSFVLQKMIADERTNKLIIIASDKAFEKIKEMIDILDVPSTGASSQGQIYVYYLKNGDSKKLAATLSGLLQGLKSKNSSSGGSGRGFGRDEMFEGEIKVSADESTNSLVIVASPRDYKSITEVIAKLDKKRTQVYIEAAIMEISLTDTNNINVGAFGGIPIGKDNTMILATPGGKSLATSMFTAIGQSLSSGNPTTAAAMGLAPFLSSLGFIGGPQSLSLNGQALTVPGIGAILDVVQQYSNVDILSTPSLMTTDNEKAEMSVGQRIPTISGASTMGMGTGASGMGIPLQNIKYEEPKLKFTITPHVNNDGQIRMEIEQDVSDLGDPVQMLGSTQYKFHTKTAKTTVVSKDQQTIVLGGLINETYKTGEEKIPFLGDIPLLGYLFKKSVKIKEKKNLMLVLTPYAVNNEEDLRKIYDRKTKEREHFAKMYFGDKITRFDPYIDYDKKVGPLAHLIEQVRQEMQKTENGGPGLPGETVVKHPEPKEEASDEHRVKLLDSSLPDPEEQADSSSQPTETVVTDQFPPQSPEPPFPSFPAGSQ